MADPSHLDRLGRELKCPICLSLLTTAVSLSCNHIFCKDCIDKSMKSASSCPVCKVPYRRREIRPAPHMDNLVSVYKSMEVASGVNMFITQAAAASKISGEGILIGVDTPKVQDNDQTQVQNINYTHKKQHQIKGSKNASVSTQISSQPNPENLSFPTKKRVLVPLYQPSGAQTEHKKLENIFGETDRKQPKKFSVPQKGISFTIEEGEPRLSPFFWLRDEDDLEKSSQHTDNNMDMFTPPDAPCFSDLKDSDDEAPCSISPERGMGGLRNRNDFFDSELFDWTQRPCSPELCPSPMAIQVEDSAEQSGAQQKVETVVTEITTKPKICSNKKSHLSKKRKSCKFSVLKSGMEMSNKKLSNLTDIRKTKRAKKSHCEGTGHDVESDSVRNQDISEGSKVNQLISKGKQRKSRKDFPDACIQEEKIPNQCDGTEPLPNSKRILTSGVSASENTEKSHRKQRKLKTSGESGKSTPNRLSKRGKVGSKVKHGKSGTGNGDMVKKTENEVQEPESNTSLLPKVSEDVLSRGLTRASEEESGKLSISLKMAKFSAEGTSKDNCNGLTLNIDEEDAKRCNSKHEIGNVTDQLRLKVPAKMDKAVSSVNRGVLLKCTTSPGTFHCAFCQSSEEYEVAGSMAHYLKGKLVADNHNAIKDAIHVHKNCTEWAPNVYFEDDNVINLEAELSRSKRIRCCCCGIKGAALGCYETSCRKSFHVTCARLTPECQWDFENFVMLCPVHASCQLPNEMAHSQSSRKRKSAPERKCSVYKAKESDECESDSIKQWKSQKKLKSLVLCCSALNSTEKGVVTELESLVGVTILKNWDSTVTHVIVSTNENGACRRTLKYLMGVLEGKWILSVKWIKACIGAREIVDEQHYEISIDIHGIRDGPRLGRLRLINKQPKLFDGFSFFFTGDFEPSYKGYLHELIIAAGGKVLNRKPVGGNAISSVRNSSKTFIIYSTELPDQSRPSNTSSILNHRRAQAEALAGPSGSMVASNSWLLNSIAGHKALI